MNGNMKEMSLYELREAIQTLSPADMRDISLTDGQPIKGFKAVYNLKHEQVESVVSTQYALIQHQSAFLAVVDALATVRTAKVRASVVEWKGRAWMTLVFPEFKADDGQEGIELGLQVKNSYRANGAFTIGAERTSNKFEWFGYRLACSNGMTVRVPLSPTAKFGSNVGDILYAKEELAQVRLNSGIAKVVHKGNSEHKMMEILYALDEVSKSIPTIEEMIRRATETAVNMDEAEKMLEELGIGSRISKKMLEKFASEEKTRWGLYNAITYEASHNEKKSPQWSENVMRMAQPLLAAAIQ